MHWPSFILGMLAVPAAISIIIAVQYLRFRAAPWRQQFDRYR